MSTASAVALTLEGLAFLLVAHQGARHHHHLDLGVAVERHEAAGAKDLLPRADAFAATQSGPWVRFVADCPAPLCGLRFAPFCLACLAWPRRPPRFRLRPGRVVCVCIIVPISDAIRARGQRRSAAGQRMRNQAGRIVPLDDFDVHGALPMAMTATERSRVRRERRAHGKVVLTVAVGEDDLTEIAAAGYAEAASTDRKDREAALSAFLADAVLGAHAMKV